MANFFNSIGVESIFLTGESPEDERKAAKKKVVEGEIKFIFVVDIYNEGVDIPEINTILFLRPTQSLTVFLQQLGRGLRLAEGKECLTVLDFVGQANKKYDFEEKFAALVSKSNRSIQKQVKDGFTHLPRGSYIQLERKAKEYILDNIRRSFGVKSGLVSRIASFEEDTGLELTLENFLIHYHLEPLDIYSKGSFSRLCVDAKIMEDFNDPEESTIAKALQRVSAIDSRRWIRFMVESLRKLEEINSSDLSNEENRMLSMFHYTIWQRPLLESGFTNLKESMLRLKRCGPLFEEIIELLEYNLTRIDFLDEPVDLGFDCPLDLHCSYTRDQILIAMDYMKPGTIREGVKFFPDKMLDLLFITLNKSDKDYSPTTMYNDYSINNKLFHWQSQSTTSETSETGQRYINHVEMGSKVLLFVREYKRTSAGGGAPYTFLGLGNYVKHEGSNPMNIVWELERPIPAKYVKKTNKLYAV
ncbi:MAG TPA: DUF3427 domain-containing protein, partial [Thermoplasmataceae archaeon]|nr:DUF3427 domain-containing protein [Thermoplasmataceae archaeon]